MIHLKFIDGVLHQSIQMQPGDWWTNYQPVPSETTPKEKSLEEKLETKLEKLCLEYHKQGLGGKYLRAPLLNAVREISEMVSE